MFTIPSPLLEQAIRSSLALRTKLNTGQLEKFVEQALHLPPQGQQELLQKLEQESIVMEKHTQKANLAIKMYDTMVQQKTNALVQEIKTNAKKSS
jgi:hypothetical protein